MITANMTNTAVWYSLTKALDNPSIRVFPVVESEKIAFPCVVYSRSSVENLQLGGDWNMEKFRYRVDIYTANYTTELVDRIVTNLRTIGHDELNHIFYQHEISKEQCLKICGVEFGDEGWAGDCFRQTCYITISATYKKLKHGR